MPPKVFVVNNRVIGTSRAIENQLGTVTEVIDDGRATKRYRVTLDNGRVTEVTNRGISLAPDAPPNGAMAVANQALLGDDDDDLSARSSESNDSADSVASEQSVSMR
jgi:hypothetical protein